MQRGAPTAGRVIVWWWGGTGLGVHLPMRRNAGASSVLLSCRFESAVFACKISWALSKGAWALGALQVGAGVGWGSHPDGTQGKAGAIAKNREGERRSGCDGWVAE